MNRKFLRGMWRLSRPLANARGLHTFRLPGLYLNYLRDWRAFRAAGGRAPFDEISPAMFDRDPSTQSGGGHYFFQDIWALTKIAGARPSEHNDIGSRLDGFVGQLTAICPVVYWDIRPPSFKLPGLTFRHGSVLEIPLADQSLASLSCLHTAEHIGLGRYGDPLDPQGTDKTMRELARLVAPGGRLLFSMPVGIEQTQFNAQRIWPPDRPIQQMAGLELVEFSAVNDAGEYLHAITPDVVARDKYACGMYEFRRPAI